MKDKCIIEIISNTEANGESDRVEVMCVGTYMIEEGKYTFRYKEQVDDSTEMNNNELIIFPKKNEIKMKKRGVIKSDMHFVEQEKTHTIYETPYGIFDMGVYTNQIDIYKNDDSIVTCRIIYSIDVDGTLLSKCDILIKIKN